MLSGAGGAGSFSFLGFSAPDDVDFVVGVDILVYDGFADVDEVHLYGFGAVRTR